MTLVLSSLKMCLDHGFDTVIDVRSPSEFADDHIPGAINLPVLNNAERAKVGTIYKLQSPFTARKLGAALVFRNAANHIEHALSHHGGAWRPMVYCWRGGQRSGSFTWMLREIGWRAEVVEGGYRTYRRLITQTLYDDPLPFRIVQLGGYTGTAKTELLHLVRLQGVQVLDLEGLAQHRGSLLGAMKEGQPSQKAFESRLALALNAMDRARPILVEAESSKIGVLNLPPSLWDAMKKAPWLEITAPLPARARYLAQAYEDILADTEGLLKSLQPLRVHRGHTLVDHWADLIAENSKLALCQSLAQDHYDPAYEKSMRSAAPKIAHSFHAANLMQPALNELAGKISERIHSMDI
ncbi:tRNA 2-selenouridine(34) synthase MnmH [Pelagimonas varians]|uniref:tRNA 2-selenouridine synthase n=1 Tax=Pelagimonas varians TaxID=696760 RepID=A0A238L738_9RHOB|nr:tRNA 2-selenouridine(34) synthase MnmH [Pelagimonas varians]PYG26292.1 tRNA 2-selenouridine synthase [Pelagimonas varians]SMX50106.1 tRNA 2-selenouridine synthase [Pelagimonas varians]